jgi:hypothetical protein
MGIPVGDLSPRGMGIGKKYSPQTFVVIPREKNFIAGTGMGSYSPMDNSLLPSLIKLDTKNPNKSLLLLKHAEWAPM